jgi:YfiH family protein
VHQVTAKNFSEFAERRIEGDGIITRLTDAFLSISVGDCLAIGLFDPDNQAIGMLHSGWKGTARRIAEAGVEAMRKAFGSEPERLEALIGPGIGFSSYQVDGPVMDEFRKYWENWTDFFCDRSSSHGFVDLAGANRWLLEHCGVPPDRIRTIELCTHTLPALFFSHRRDGLPGGRMFAMGSIRD